MYPQTYWGKRMIVLTPVTSPSVTQRIVPSPGSTRPSLGLENAFQKPLEGWGFLWGHKRLASLQGPAMNLSATNSTISVYLSSLCVRDGSQLAGSVSSSATWGHHRSGLVRRGNEEF